MKTYLFLYTQTASTPKNYNLNSENYKEWPRAITINWRIGNSYKSFIIRPTGFHIEPITSEYTGISNESAINKGEDISLILKKFLEDVDFADYIVGHNIEFHLNVIKSELLRNNIANNLEKVKTICLMNYGKDFTKIISNNGYKFPSLSELYKYVTNKDLSDNYNRYINNIFPKIAYAHLCALPDCFFYMEASYVFSNINIIPPINYFIIPFVKDNFPKIKNIKLEDTSLLLGQTIILDNVIEIQELEKSGLYIIKKADNLNKTKFLLLDYRGILIYESNVEIEVGFHVGMEENGVFLGRLMLYYITYVEFGIVIHQYEAIKNSKILIIPDFFKRKTVISNNAKIILENSNLIYNLEADYLIDIKDSYYDVYDLNGTFIKKFHLNQFEIYDISSTNHFYITYQGKQGLIDINGELIVNPTYKSINIVDNNYYYFSNNVYISENVVTPKKIGLCKINGEEIFEDIYDDIIIDNNIITAIKDEEEFVFDLTK